MKKIQNYLLMVAMVCGISFAAASCSSNDDNPVIPDLSVAEKIIGKWIVTDKNGQPLSTNKKAVYTFVSTTKALVSVSITSHPEVGKLWCEETETNVAINGNKMTLNSRPDENTTVTEVLNFTDISATEFTANYEITMTEDGKVVKNEQMVLRFTKVTADYSEKVLGLWECESLMGGETYNDANGRLEFLADGTYRYYRKNDDGQWQTITAREFQDYFVDGTLLATRWKNRGDEELREWWEIATLSGNEMVWTSQRQNADGSTFQQEMKWKKVDLNVAEMIMGKWIKSDQNGQPLPTDGKMVYTFVSTTKAYMSASIDASPEVGTHWIDQLEADVTISGNKVSLTRYSEEGATMVVDYIITAIDDKEFTANHKVTIMLGGAEVYVVEDILRFDKLTTNYAAAIVGLWECQEITGGETYNDPNGRLEFKNDGTYNFYRKDDAGQWQVVTTREFQDCFVDGTLLATRWKNQGEAELREWWEIASISDGQMQWVALRRNADGTTFVQGMKWKKVNE